MTQAEYHELQLRRIALFFDEQGLAGRGAAKILRDAADFIQHEVDAEEITLLETK